MNFEKSLKHLGIEEYADRIINSNSRGDLFHLMDYIELAEHFSDMKLFSELFKEIVKLAEQQWKRPESVFQHIPRLLEKSLKSIKA